MTIKPVDDDDEVAKEMYGGEIPRVDAVKGPASRMRFLVLKAGQPQDTAAVAALQSATSKETPMRATKEAQQAPGTSEQKPVAKSRQRRTADPVEPVVKADEPEDDLDAGGEVLVADGPGGDATVPGSGGWEQIDADTAQKWTAILGRAKVALGVLSDREAQEVASPNGDDDDAENAWDLEDASCAIDYAIGILAAYAAGEQTEADVESQGVVKALEEHGADDVMRSLNCIEGLMPVAKAGRVLSASNEQAIKDAVDKLQGVLSSLPAAPEAEPANKSQEDAVEATDERTVFAFDRKHEFMGMVSSSALLTDGAPVRKAKGDPMVACYNAAGDLIGVVDPGDLVAVGAGTPAEEADPDDDGDDDADAADATAPAAPAAAPAPAAATAAAAPAAAAPAQKSMDKPVDIAEVISSAVAKALSEIQEGDREVIKGLEARVAAVEGLPAGGGPLLSAVAQLPSGNHVIVRGDTSTLPPEILAVRKQLEAAEGSGVRTDELRKQLAFEVLKYRAR